MVKDAMAKLTKIWKIITSEERQRERLYKPFPIATYGSESWTVNASRRRRIEAFEMHCYRKMLRISWIAHRTNISILRELNIQPNERLLPSIQR